MQYNNEIRRLINERKENLEKIKILFHKATKGSDIYFKTGKMYRNTLNSIKEMEGRIK